MKFDEKIFFLFYYFFNNSYWVINFCFFEYCWFIFSLFRGGNFVRFYYVKVFLKGVRCFRFGVSMEGVKKRNL